MKCIKTYLAVKKFPEPQLKLFGLHVTNIFYFVSNKQKVSSGCIVFYKTSNRFDALIGGMTDNND